MLRLTTLTAIALAAAQPAFAAPAVEYGEGDGERFQYTTELRADGIIHIAGVMLGSREPFVLNMTPKGQVDGSFGDVAVEYRVSKHMRDRVAAQFVAGRSLAEATPQE